MAMSAVNPTGLRVKPTYESQVNYIANQPRIAYPDRNATMLARSLKMGQLFQENAAQMAEQQMRAKQNQQMNAVLQQVVQRGLGGGTPGSSGFVTGMATPGGTTESFLMHRHQVPAHQCRI